MGGTLATGSSIYMASAGVPAADGAGLSSIKSFSQLLTSIAAMPLAGGTFTGHVLFTDNTYDIGASGATRPRTVYAGTSVITPLVNNPSAALTLGNSTGVTVPGKLSIGRSPSVATTALDVYNASAAVQATIQSGNNYCELLLTSGSSSIQNYITSNGSLEFYIGGATRLTINQSTGAVSFSGAVTATGTVTAGTYTVATLPAAVSNAGKMAQVTDSNVAASGNYGATVAAGGANRVKVFSDGTNWVIA